MAEQNGRETALTFKRTSSCKVSDLKDGPRYPKEWSEKNEGTGDLTIVVNGKSTVAHRKVLMETSDYFKTMFEGGFSETTATSIDLSNSFDYGEMSVILDYIYTGDISLSEDNILFVVRAASMFQLLKLESACSEFLIANIAPSTSIAIFIVAETYSLLELQRACLEVIRSWFPFTLCHSQDAIEMPPACLRLLIKEGVMSLLSEDTRNTFLLKWHEHFKESANSNVALPKEVKDLLPTEDDSKKDGEGGAQSQQDDIEEVLLTFMFAPSSGSKQCITEIHAFSPNLKTWKLVLAHAFGKLVKPKAIPKLVGLTETKAFFSFFKEDLVRSHECVISVDLATKAERIIKVPKSVYSYATSQFDESGYPHYFVWDNHLCAAYFKKRCNTWGLFRNQHETKCSEECKGECWDLLCDIPRIREEDYQHFNQYLTKEFKSDLYVWAKNDTDFGCCLSDMKYFRISHAPSEAGEYQVTELPAPWANDGRFQEVTNESNWDTFFTNIIAKETLLCSISLDAKTQLMTFHLKADCDDKEPFHKEYLHMYDLSKNKWKESKFCKMLYPENYKGALRYVENDDSDDEEQNWMFFRRHDYDEDDPYTNPYSQYARSTPELCIYDYFAKQTSPYNATVWKLEPDCKNYPIVTHFPHALYKFQGYLMDDMRRGFFKSLPNADFKDFSEEIGQSAVAYLSSVEDGVEIEFEKLPIDHKKYENLWGKLWQKSVKPEDP